MCFLRKVSDGRIDRLVLWLDVGHGSDFSLKGGVKKTARRCFFGTKQKTDGVRNQLGTLGSVHPTAFSKAHTLVDVTACTKSYCIDYSPYLNLYSYW